MKTYVSKLLLALLLVTFASYIFGQRIIGTDGTIASYNPAPPTPPFAVSKTGPYIDGVNKAMLIENICIPGNVLLSANTIITKGYTYQWYKCVATLSIFTKLTPKYSWGSWSAISGATLRTYTVDSKVDFASKYTLHVIYVCKITNTLTNTSTYTGAVGISRASAPVLKGLTVEAAYFCPNDDVTIQADYEVAGDKIEVWWEYETPSGAGNWEKVTNATDPFTFPGASYLNGTYDYRLKISHSCVDYESARFSKIPVVVQQAYVESYAPGATYTVKTCLNSTAEMNLELAGKNNFFNYTYKWYYKASDAATWTEITSTNGGVFADYNTLSLKVTPNSEAYHNMQFRCTTTGACATITSSPFTLKLTVPPVISDIKSDDIVCPGETVEFKAVIDSNSLAEPVQYRWRVGDNIAIGQNFSADNHTFTYTAGTEAVFISCEVQNGTECIGITDSYTKKLNLYNNPDVSINVSTSGCGAVLATLTAEVSGGKEPYSYKWSSLEETKIIENKTTNFLYAVSVTDACSKKDTSSVFVSSLPILNLTATKTDVVCYGQANGKIAAIITGGVAPYNILIKKGNDTIALFKDTLYGLINLDNLYAGTYTVKVTDKCLVDKSMELIINQPNELTSIISDYSNVTCNNGGDGHATVSISGGTIPYIINWSNGQHTITASGLFAGNYIANITDNNGCFISANITISQPEKFNAVFLSSDITCNGNNNGEITIYPQGGTEPYKTYISDENNNIISGTVFHNLSPGIYKAYASDNCGAYSDTYITIGEPDVLKYSVEKSDISCNGYNNGSITVIPNAGIEPYSIIWEDSSVNFTRTNLQKGYYSFTLYDNCDSLVDSVYIDEPDELTVSVNAENIVCPGVPSGVATAVVTGGSIPYSYTWSNGMKSESISNIYAGDYTVQVVDAKGCLAVNSATVNQTPKLQATAKVSDIVCPGTTGSIYIDTIFGYGNVQYNWSITDWDGLDTIYNVSAGNYYLTVIDECNSTVKLDIEVKELNKHLDFTITKTDIQCKGQENGTIDVKMKEGVAPYSFDICIVTETDSICSLYDYKDNFSFTNLPKSKCYYTVTDACVSLSDVLEINEPELLQASVNTKDVSCKGKGDGAAKVIVTGGSQPYIYNWSIGIQKDSLMGLFAGDYSVNVFDANGCFTSASFEINEPEALDINLDIVDSECKAGNGNIKAIITGGTEPYIYKWSNNKTSTFIDSLSAGKYSLTVTDANNCIETAYAKIGEYAPVYPICVITVDREIGKNKIVWEKINNSAITKVNVFRMVGGEYQLMGSVDSIKQSYFDDKLSMPETVAARYAITTNDACGNESKLSPFHQTIHLGSAKGSDGTSNVLDWTEYIDESGTFKPVWYYLYRGKTKSDMQLFDSVNSIVSTEYNDINPQGAIYYRVGVLKADPCITTGILKSESGPYSQSLSNITEASISITKIKNEEFDKYYVLYPNPNKGDFSILSSSNNQKAIKIFNVAGKLIKEVSSENKETKIDLTSYSKGIFTITIIENNKSYTRQIVVE